MLNNLYEIKYFSLLPLKFNTSFNVTPSLYLNLGVDAWAQGKMNYGGYLPTSSIYTPTIKDLLTANAVNQITGGLSDKLSNQIFGNDTELGRALGNLFSSGINSAGNTIANNVLKGTALGEGLTKNVSSSLAGAASGLAANYIGLGISSLGGDSKLSRGIGLGVATGLGTIGGQLASKGPLSFEGSGLFGKTPNGAINPYALGASMIGTGLQSAFGPSKEYGGKYGNITKTMDNVYDYVKTGASFIPGVGQGVAAAMELNKGLSNIFGSTSGMTRQDAILGSAFMPAPFKWLNMAGAKTTGTFNDLSWLNTESTRRFMLNGFGNLTSKLDEIMEKAGKTYGTWSRGAYKSAVKDLDWGNNAWKKLLKQTKENEIYDTASLTMTSINNLRYANSIQGILPILQVKNGAKLEPSNLGQRLLSAAALIDDKQMILSFLGGGRPMRPKAKPHRKGELPAYTEEEKQQLAEWDAYKLKKIQENQERIARRNGANARGAERLHQTADIAQSMTSPEHNTVFTGLEYQQAAENLRQEKVENFHEKTEELGKGLEAALTADLAVSAAPLLQRGFRWAFNKAGLLVKVPILTSENITENFLKFVGGSGKPVSLAIPKTLAQIEMYQMLELSGVDMSKIGIEDINKALELRLQLLFASNKRFSFLEPVTHNTELIRDIDNGLEVGYIGLKKPYLTNNKGFAEDTWILYSSNPRNKGLKIDMVENLSLTKPGFNKVYHGEQERLTNSAIQVGKQLGYEGVVSGESLLSPEKNSKNVS